MLIEIAGNQGLIAEQPNVIITFSEEEDVEYDFHLMILYYRANDKLFSPC